MAVSGRYADSYDLDVALKLDVEDMITLLSPFDAPFQGTFNGIANPGTEVNSILPTGEVFERRYDWLEDELLTPRSKVGENYTSGGGTLTVATGEGIRFSIDDLIKVGDAQYRVTAVDIDEDELSISLWSGTAANADEGDQIITVGTLPREGADPVDGRYIDRTRPFNVTQIFGPYPIEMSETEQVVKKYGVTSEWQHQVVKRVREAAIAMEQALIYGVRKDDPTERRRSFGGINYWIDAANGSAVDSTTTSLAGQDGEDAFAALMQECYDRGGDPRLAVTGPANKPDISGWRRSDIRLEQGQRHRGQVVTSFETDFNIVDLLMHRWVLPNNVFLFNPEQTEVPTLTGRGMKWVKTAKTGDRDQSYVITEKGFKFRGASHAGKFTALGTGS